MGVVRKELKKTKLGDIHYDWGGCLGCRRKKERKTDLCSLLLVVLKCHIDKDASGKPVCLKYKVDQATRGKLG